MAIMRKAFQMFDTSKSGFIETIKIATILNTMGQLFDETELQALIVENDPESKFYHRSPPPIFQQLTNNFFFYS